MMFLGLAIHVSSLNYTGKQTANIKKDATEDIVVNDCTFINIGTTTSDSPIFIYGTLSTVSVNLTNNMFQDCQAGQGGAFSLTGSYQLNLMMNAVWRCSVDNNKQGAIGLVWVENSTITYLSAVQCQRGAKNLYVQGRPMISYVNMSTCNSAKGMYRYSYGNLYVENAARSFRIVFCNFEKNYSPDSTIYIKDCKSIRFDHSNIIANEVSDWSIVLAEGSDTVITILSSVFQKNILGSAKLFDGYSGLIMVAQCEIDVLTITNTVSTFTNTIVDNATPIAIDFYATGKIQAKKTYTYTAQTTQRTEKSAAAIEGNKQKGKDETDVFRLVIYTVIGFLVVFIIYVVAISVWSTKKSSRFRHHNSDESYTEQLAIETVVSESESSNNNQAPAQPPSDEAV